MVDIASIGVETHVTNGDAAIRQLNAFGKATEGAENSARGASSATNQYNKMLVDLLRSIDRTLFSMNAMQRTTSGMSLASIKAAEDSLRLARATERQAEAALQAERAQVRAAAATAAAAKAAKQASVDIATLYDTYQKDFVTQYVNGANRYTTALSEVEKVQQRVDKTGKYLTQTTLNLSRQFADVAVTAAMGMPAYMILIQQGPQIADAFATAKTEGIGFRQALSGINAMAKPFVPVILAGAAAMAVFGVAFAAFERQIDKDTKYATTWGDTWTATIKVIGGLLMKGPIGDGLRWIKAEWERTLDAIASMAFQGTTRTLAFFSASYKTIVANWNNLPAAFDVIFVEAANVGLRAVSWLVNGNIKLFNKMIEGWNALGPLKAPTIPEVDLDQFMLKPMAAAKKASADFNKFYADDLKGIQATARGIGAAIASQADKEYLARQKAAKGARDHAKELKVVNQAAIDGGKAYAKLTEEVLRLYDAMNKKLNDMGMSELQKKLRELREDLNTILMWEDGMRTVLGPAAALNTEVLEQYARAIEMVNVQLERTPETLSDAAAGLKKANSEWENALDLANDLSNSIDVLFNNIRNRDWANAFQGLREVFDKLSTAFKSGTTMDKISAVSAVGYSAGQAIGGRAGKIISGASSGAAAGAQIGSMFGPTGTVIGTVIGGVAGALSGIFGKSEKAKRREAEAQKALERAMEIALQKREMEAQLLLLQGKATESLAAMRALELEKLDLSLRGLHEQIYAEQDAATLRQFNLSILKALGKEEEYLAASRAEELRSVLDIHKPLQQSIWALEDLKEASEKLAETARTTATIQQSILRAMGDEAGALAVQRQQELQSMDASLRPLQQAAWALEDAQAKMNAAREALADAIRRDMAELEDTISNLNRFAESLRRFNEELQFNPANSNMSPGPQYDVLSREFERLAALPPGDLERLENLQRVSELFLAASKENASTGSQYNRDLQAVRRATEASQLEVERQVTEAEKQLEALNTLAAGLGIVNGSVVSVEVGIQNLAAATASYAAAQQAATSALTTQLAVQAAAQAQMASDIAAAQAAAQAALAAAQANAAQQATKSFDPAGYLSKNPDVAAEFARHTTNADIAYLASIGVYNAEGYAAYHYQKWGKNEGRPFATGGAFSGGLVQGPTSFNMGLMGEKGPEAILPLTNVNGKLGVHANDNSMSIEAIRRLHDSMQEAVRYLRGIEMLLNKMELTMDRWDRLGLYVRGESPDEPVSTKEAA
jgi:hypothetical protein